MIDFAEITDEISATSDKMRFILVIDEKGIPIYHRILSKSFALNEKQSIALASDMLILKQLLRLYDDMIGENQSVHLVREKVHALIFYFKGMIFLVSLERSLDRKTVAEISDKIESIIHDT